MPDSPGLVVKLGKAASALLYVLAVVLAFPIGNFVASILFWENLPSQAHFVAGLSVALTLALLFATNIVRYQRIQVTPTELRARFTRYGVRRALDAKFSEIDHVLFLPGLYGFDGHPRPLLEVYGVQRSMGWVPLPLYENRQIGLVLAALRAGGVRVVQAKTAAG
jgi:hypothetical protein